MIRGFHSVTFAARDLGASADAFARFLARPAAKTPMGVAFSLANVAIDLRAAASDEAGGLVRVTFAVDDLDEARRMLERRGATTREEGPVAVIDRPASHGVELALAHASRNAPDSGGPDAIQGLDHVVIRTAAPERAIAFYGARLGLDFRLDRANPAWGARLLFFRCGDAVVEVSASLEPGAPETPDRFGGVALRISDPAAAHARLSGAGFAVSELRQGRKPGTQVFTLREGLPGAPFLLLSAESRPSDARAAMLDQAGG